MYLGNPLLPLKINEKSAISSIEKIFQERNWTDYRKSKTKLILIPYFYFSYHYFKEKIVGDEKIVENSIDGFSALNASNLKIEKDISELILKNINELTNDSPKMDFVKEDCVIEKKEVDDVIKLKIAETFHIPKQNIVLSNAKKCYVPLFDFTYIVNEKELVLRVNAVNGQIINSDIIPIREKGFSEVTKETLEELSEPKNWLKYTKEIFVKTGSTLSGKTKKVLREKNQSKKSGSKKNFDFGIPKLSFLSFLSSKLSWFIIILLALFLIYLALFF